MKLSYFIVLQACFGFNKETLHLQYQMVTPDFKMHHSLVLFV